MKSKSLLLILIAVLLLSFKITNKVSSKAPPINNRQSINVDIQGGFTAEDPIK